MSDSRVKEGLADWLEREMPAGTIIGNPRWWAPKIVNAIAALSAAPEPQAEPATSGEVDDLHREIMNLQQPMPPDGQLPNPSYMLGFRDARHAAAELVWAHCNQQAQRIAELEAQLAAVGRGMFPGGRDDAD